MLVTWRAFACSLSPVAPGLQRWRLALIDSVLGGAGCVCEAIFLHLSLRPTVSRPGGRVLMDAGH